MTSAAVGVDLGGSKIAAALVRGDHVGDVVSTPTPAGAEAILDAVADLVRRVTPAPGIPIGVASAGAVDASAGVVVSATATIPGWAGTRLEEGLRARIPGATKLATLNDVAGHALGEAWAGAARSVRSAFVVAVGTGVGGALVMEGRVLGGARHLAGAIAHLPTPGARGYRCPCGRDGHLEAVVSGPGLAALYERSSGRSAEDGRVVARWADAGDPAAVHAIRRSARILGRALAGVAATVDPDLIVVGGGLAELGHGWWESLTRAVAREAAPALSDMPVVRAELGSRAAIVGAARAASDA